MQEAPLSAPYIILRAASNCCHESIQLDGSLSFKMMSSATGTRLILLLMITQQVYSRPAETSDNESMTQSGTYHILPVLDDDVSVDLAARGTGHENAHIISATTVAEGSKPATQNKPSTGQAKPPETSTGQGNSTGTQTPSLTSLSGSAQLGAFLSNLLGQSGAPGGQQSNHPPSLSLGSSQVGGLLSSIFGHFGAAGGQQLNQPPTSPGSGASQFGSSSFGSSFLGSSGDSAVFPGNFQPPQVGFMSVPPPMFGGSIGGSGNSFGGWGSPFGSGEASFTAQPGSSFMNGFTLPPWVSSLMKTINNFRSSSIEGIRY